MNLMKKKLNKKGFTLAELLIVVAIIAVLVAIAIPVFGGQLKKAEESVIAANLRSARAEASVEYLMNGRSGTHKYSFGVTKDGKITVTHACSDVSGADAGSQSGNDSCEKGNTNGGYTGEVYITGKDYSNNTIGGVNGSGT